MGQAGQNVEINTVVCERLRVLAKAKSFEPLRDVVSHGASLRQAGFAEAVEEVFVPNWVGRRCTGCHFGYFQNE